MPGHQVNTPIRAMLRDVWVLMRATLIAQAIGLLIIPILSRLYGPSDFGAFALYQAALLLLSVVACLRYDQAILTAVDENEAAGLFRLSLIIAALAGLFIFILSAVTVAVFSDVAALGTISILWLAPATFLTGAALAASCYFTRLNKFAVTGRSKIAQSTLGGGVSAGLGYAAPSGVGLAVGDMAGKSIVTLFALRLLGGPGSLKSHPANVSALARKYADFPRYSILGGLLNNGGSFMLPFVLFHICGAEIAGQFALVDRVISLPLGLVIATLSQAFSAHCGRLLREGREEALPYFKALVSRLALWAVLPTALGYVFAPHIFPLVFGDEWALAGHYAQLLALMYFSSLVMGPVNSALVIAGRLKLQLIWETIRFVMLVAAFALAVSGHWPAEAIILGYALINIIANFAFVAIAWKEVGAASRRSMAVE